jgi:hypothetical protein
MTNRLLCAALAALSACGVSTPRTTPVTVPFQTIFADVDVIALEMTSGSRLVSPAGAFVTGGQLIVADQASANVKVFDRSSGMLTRVIGGPGDATGEFRRPTSVAALDSGRFVVFDSRRRILSFRDSIGGVLGETPQLKGAFYGVVGLPDEHHVLLAGAMTNSTIAGDVHELDYAGRRIASYVGGTKPRSLWEMTYSATFVTRIGETTVTGSMRSNELQLYNSATKRTTSMAVAPDWYAPMDWPSDDVLTARGPGHSSADRIKEFSRTHRMMSGIVPLTGGRFLVRFRAFTSATDNAYYYALGDTTGRTLIVTQATRANVVAARGDTVFWIAPGTAGGTRFGSGVLGTRSH